MVAPDLYRGDTMDRPYVICHMLQSIDGKVTGDYLYKKEVEAGTDIYYEINRQYRADAYACGRVTMESSFTNGYYPDLSGFEDIERSDYVADREAGFFAVAFDRRGRLGWKESRIRDEDCGYDNAHIIEVLTEAVDGRYLAYLKSIGVSYIFADDIATALKKLKTLFNINKLLLEGGSNINGAFNREGLVDEISLVVVPVVADSNGKTLFSDSTLSAYKLNRTEGYDNGVIYLNYKR